VLLESITMTSSKSPNSSRHFGRFFSSFLTGTTTVKGILLDIFIRLLLTYFSFFNKFYGITADHRPWIHILEYRGACTHYGTLADRYTRHNKCFSRYPNKIMKMYLPDDQRCIEGVYLMGCAAEVGPLGYHYLTSYHRLSYMQFYLGSQCRFLPHLQIPG